MIPRKLFRCVTLAIIAVLAGALAAAADDFTDKGDEKLLQDARVGTDGPALLDFFRRRTLTPDDEQRLRELVGQLGDRRFAVREKASREFIERGRSALKTLRDALAHADAEVARRAKACITAIESGPGPALPGAAARVLARRAPAGAVAALLAYMPFADDVQSEEEVLGALIALGTRPGKAAAALTIALADPAPARRAAAAYVLGRHPDRAEREAAASLLTDPQPFVRFRAAQGLLAGREPRAVPVLIALLADGPADLTRQAEELLWALAGDRSPPLPAGADAAAARRAYRDAWARWWDEYGKGIDLARLTDQLPSLGLTLIAQADKVWECGPDGKARWTIGGLQQPIEALVLPGNRVLITENTGRRVSERDQAGKILWEYKAPAEALSARRLPSGHTFISTNSTVTELGRDGKEVYSHKFPAPGAGGHRINSACKLRNGRLLVLTDDGTMAEVDAATGKVLTARQAPDRACYSVEPLPSGGWLVAAYGSGKVVEFDASGKAVWEHSLASAFHAKRLPNGHTLISSHGTGRIIEVTPAGKIVWEQRVSGNVWRVHRR